MKPAPAPDTGVRSRGYCPACLTIWNDRPPREIDMHVHCVTVLREIAKS